MQRTFPSTLHLFFALLLFSILAAGCDNGEQNIGKEAVQSQSIKLGLIPEHDIFTQKQRYEPLTYYLGQELNLNIKLKILSRYGNIIDNFVSESLDAAFFGSFTGALALKKLGVQFLARPEYNDGTSTYYGMVFVRKDSDIKNSVDMKGKTFAFVDKATTAGWLLPIHFLHDDLGIEDHRSWFAETYFTGTHEDAIYDVLQGKADVGAAKNTVFYRLADSDPRILEELEILTTSPKVPANGLAVRNGFDSSLAGQLKETLLTMHENSDGRKVLAEFGAKRFIETTQKDYQPVFEYAEHIGLDLAAYEYTNE